MLTLLDETFTDLMKLICNKQEPDTCYYVVTIPYIQGTSETISWISQPYNIKVTHEPSTTLQHLPTNVKDRDKPNNRQGAVYKIKI